MSGTSWEGSDSWIRAQFAKYIQCLLNSTARVPHVFDSTPPEELDFCIVNIFFILLKLFTFLIQRAWTRTVFHGFEHGQVRTILGSGDKKWLPRVRPC